MTKTAVGLFENSGSADGVVRDLTAKGFLQKDIRVLGEPVEMPGSGLMSTPHSDFEVDLVRDLTAFGVVEGDAEAYVQGVRRGGVMVFATGTGKNADQAAEIMNCHGAVEIEKISATRPAPSECGNRPGGSRPGSFDPNGQGAFRRFRRSPVCLVVSSRSQISNSRSD
jgi:hypothetical protein